MEIVPPWFHLPSKSTISVNSNDISRSIVITIPNEGSLEISIFPSTCTSAENGVWGVFLPNDDLAVLRYNVNIKLKYRPYSINGKYYLRWYKNVLESFQVLDWETIDANIEKSLLRNLLEKAESK